MPSTRKTPAPRLDDGDTFTVENLSFRVRVLPDDSGDAPWEREDGHGPVSEWRVNRDTPFPDKRPGERVLCYDRHAARLYDFQGAIAKAKKERWGLSPENLQALSVRLGRAPTPGEITTQAVEDDFARLQAWCNDDWSYVVVSVELLDIDGEGTGIVQSLWGIESDADDYLSALARELAREISCTISRRARTITEGARRITVRSRPEKKETV